MATLARIRIGTRKSALALAQAEEVRTRLIAAWPELAEEGAVTLVRITTSGDIFTDRPLADIGGKGLFTKEIEEALFAGTIDIAVHSMKDMQTILPEGLTIGCVLPREDTRDMLVGHGIASLDDVPKNARFGTSSLRRSAQLLLKRPDICIIPLRGNVQTRLEKLKKGDMRATMLAKAGLNRLGLYDVPGIVLDNKDFLPAVAQGAIGIECRVGDAAMSHYLTSLNDYASEVAITCERAFLRALDGSCRTPIAGYASLQEGVLHFNGLIVRPDGSAHHAITMQGQPEQAEALGREAGEALLRQAGAGFI